MADHPINLTTLQQQDPYITEILCMATQVHLYNYNVKIKSEWDKSDIGGSLFVYKRSACPIHGMMILNRQGMENWVEPISEHLEFQVSTPFLLYRCNKRIQGIWFYKPKECEEVGELMDNLREEAVRSQADQADLAQASLMKLGQRNVDIMQLLSGAQQRYESKVKTKGGGPEPQNISTTSSGSTGPPLIKPTPVKGDSGGGSAGGDGPSQLQELFKNVKLTQQLQQRPGGMVDQYAGDPPPDVTINPLHSKSVNGAPSSSVGSAKDSCKKKINAVKCREYRQRLKEDPEHYRIRRQADQERCRQYRRQKKTEDQLERERELTRHRMKRYYQSLSVTEVESGTAPRTLPPAGGLTVEEIERQQREQIQRSDSGGQGQPGQAQEAGMSQSPATKDLMSILTAAAGDGQGGTLPAMPQVPHMSAADVGAKESAEPGAGSLTELLTPGDFDKHLTASSHQRESGSGGPLGGVCPDVLMTPMAFTGPQRLPPAAPSPTAPFSSTALLEQLNTLQRGRALSSPGFSSPPPPEITPLTRHQLQQALIHIIRTDEDFVARLHDAYLSSFRQQLGAGGGASGKR